PRPLLIPLIMLMAVIGSYAYQGNPYEVVIMLVFGLVGFGMRIFGIPEAPMVITFLITPMAEASVRRALLINQGDWFAALFHSPLAIGLFVSVLVLSYLAIRLRVGERLTEMSGSQAEGMEAAKD
ncbi:MAG: tripartite tricarboxylate transporter permease, partial [Alphaproteobacteria bacterium]